MNIKQRDDQEIKLLSLPDRPRDIPSNNEDLTNQHLSEETLAHLLAHAQTRIRHLTQQTRAPITPWSHTASIALQTDPPNPSKNVSARTNRRAKRNQNTASNEAGEEPPDLDEVSWETITAEEYALIQEQWWHDAKFENDLLGSRKELNPVDPCATPLSESDQWQARHDRRLLVADVAKPIWLSGVEWDRVKNVVGVLPCCNEGKKDGSTSPVQFDSFKKVLPMGEDDDVITKVQEIQPRSGKWRIFKDKRTGIVHRELILDRIDDVRVPRKYMDTEESERTLVKELAAEGTEEVLSKKWADWMKLVRELGPPVKVVSLKPNNTNQTEEAKESTKKDKLEVSRTSTKKETLAHRVAQLRKEEMILENALFELQSRHKRDELKSKFNGLPGVKVGTVNSRYLEQVWKTATQIQ